MTDNLSLTSVTQNKNTYLRKPPLAVHSGILLHFVWGRIEHCFLYDFLDIRRGILLLNSLLSLLGWILPHSALFHFHFCFALHLSIPSPKIVHAPFLRGTENLHCKPAIPSWILYFWTLKLLEDAKSKLCLVSIDIFFQSTINIE